MKKTTDLRELKKGADYVWGKIIKIHEIGKYSIVEFERTKDMEIRFHAYVDDFDTHYSFPTMEEALIIKAIACYQLGMDSQANHFIMKLLK